MGIDGQDELSPSQRRFVEEYLRDMKPKAAAIRAGFADNNAAKSAWRLLHHPGVAAAIRAEQCARSDRLRLSIDRVVQEHARLALADIGRIVRLTKKGPRLRDPAGIGPDDSAAVREVISRKGGFQIRLYDKTRSLHALTEMLGVVERYRAVNATMDERERQRVMKAQENFRRYLQDIRERLGLDPKVSLVENLAEGVVLGDAEAIAAAEKMGFGPAMREPASPEPPSDP